MAKNNTTYNINLLTITGPAITLPTTDAYSLYLITGDINTSEATEHITIDPSGDAVVGLKYSFAFPANVTIGGSFGIQLFGRTLTALEGSTSNQIDCIYNGTTWDIFIY